jgi:hypothetical protein
MVIHGARARVVPQNPSLVPRPRRFKFKCYMVCMLLRGQDQQSHVRALALLRVDVYKQERSKFWLTSIQPAHGRFRDRFKTLTAKLEAIQTKMASLKEELDSLIAAQAMCEEAEAEELREIVIQELCVSITRLGKQEQFKKDRLSFYEGME